MNQLLLVILTILSYFSEAAKVVPEEIVAKEESVTDRIIPEVYSLSLGEESMPGATTESEADLERILNGPSAPNGRMHTIGRKSDADKKGKPHMLDNTMTGRKGDADKKGKPHMPDKRSRKQADRASARDAAILEKMQVDKRIALLQQPSNIPSNIPGATAKSNSDLKSDLNGPSVPNKNGRANKNGRMPITGRKGDADKHDNTNKKGIKDDADKKGKPGVQNMDKNRMPGRHSDTDKKGRKSDAGKKGCTEWCKNNWVVHEASHKLSTFCSSSWANGACSGCPECTPLKHASKEVSSEEAKENENALEAYRLTKEAAVVKKFQPDFHEGRSA